MRPKPGSGGCDFGVIGVCVVVGLVLAVFVWGLIYYPPWEDPIKNYNGPHYIWHLIIKEQLDPEETENWFSNYRPEVKPGFVYFKPRDGTWIFIPSDRVMQIEQIKVPERTVE